MRRKRRKIIITSPKRFLIFIKELVTIIIILTLLITINQKNKELKYNDLELNEKSSNDYQINSCSKFDCDKYIVEYINDLQTINQKYKECPICKNETIYIETVADDCELVIMELSDCQSDLESYENT